MHEGTVVSFKKKLKTISLKLEKMSPSSFTPLCSTLTVITSIFNDSQKITALFAKLQSVIGETVDRYPEMTPDHNPTQQLVHACIGKYEITHSYFTHKQPGKIMEKPPTPNNRTSNSEVLTTQVDKQPYKDPTKSQVSFFYMIH